MEGIREADSGGGRGGGSRQGDGNLAKKKGQGKIGGNTILAFLRT